MDARPVELVRRDHYRLHGRWWSGGGQDVVVVACATGIPASDYRRYAAWLAGNGQSCLTFGYRGIGESREPGLSDRATRWYQWGSLDIDAARPGRSSRHPVRGWAWSATASAVSASPSPRTPAGPATGRGAGGASGGGGTTSCP